MNASNANVVHAARFEAQSIECFSSFFGYRHVARSCRDDGNGSARSFDRGAQFDKPSSSNGRIPHLGNHLGDDGGFGSIEARNEHVCLGSHHFLGNMSDLLTRFSFAKNDFWNALSQGSMMVDGGKTQVFERQSLQRSNGLLDIELTFADLLEQFTHAPRIHGRPLSMSRR